MRKIKFRAWDLTNADGPEMTFFKVGQGFSGMDGCPIMQFTGLKDKNGKEIYEGDVITTQSGGIGEVLFWCGGWMKTPIPKEGEYPLLLWQEPILEIIGNIYSNPELLK